MAAMQTSGATERPWLNRSLATVREQVSCVSRIDRLAGQFGQHDSLVIRLVGKAGQLGQQDRWSAG